MTLIAFSGDQPRARYVNAGGQPIALLIGTGTDCCNDCEPCCPCSQAAPPESCGLQSITVVFDFQTLGTCGPCQFSVTITAADEDSGFPWSKAINAQAGTGTVSGSVALFCDGTSYCYVITGSLIFQGCSFCSGTTALFPNMRLSGVTNESGDCCPVGGEYQWLIECNPEAVGVVGTMTATFVY